jgi:hypothetical protein
MRNKQAIYSILRWLQRRTTRHECPASSTKESALADGYTRARKFDCVPNNTQRVRKSGAFASTLVQTGTPAREERAQNETMLRVQSKIEKHASLSPTHH